MRSEKERGAVTDTRGFPALHQLRPIKQTTSLVQQTTLAWTCLLAAFLLPSVLALPHPCSSNEVSTGGTTRCCRACPPGSGVISGCNDTSDTQCESCEPNKTFSHESSHDTPCLPCRGCPENTDVVRSCNTTHDVLCECRRKYFLKQQLPMQCALCDVCPAGQGTLQSCTPVQNTRCKRCEEGMFSAQRGLEPCKTCTVCGEEQLVLQRCRPTEDTICMDITPVKPTVLPFFPKTVSTLSHNVTDTGKSDILPVYCAFLAGLVAGLLAYVIVLQIRRNRARRNKASYVNSTAAVREGARLAPGGSNPQIPNQGSDSGVFVDNDIKTVAVSPSFRIRDLPPPLKRTLETSIHAAPDNRGGWRNLARQLGYNSSRVSAFQTRANRDDALPARYLLSDWSKKSHATVGALQVALHKIGRDDVTSMFHSDHMPPHPGHCRSRESVNLPLARSNSTNHDHRSKSVGLNNLERQPEGAAAAAQPEVVTPQHRNHRRSLAMSMAGSQRLVNI